MSDLRTVRDQLDREVTFSFPPKRIVSLVPSQTEFLLDIGAPVVGRTKFCIHPAEKVKDIPIIGGTKNFRFKEIQALNPDLIIGNKEENFEQGIEELASFCPVWLSDVKTLPDAYAMMQSIGELCHLSFQSEQIVSDCKSAMGLIKGSKQGRVIYLIWKNPWMAAGKDTFIDHMLSHMGYENAVLNSRYPELSDEELRELDPDLILFSSEPYPFKEKHIAEMSRKWPNVNCEVIDGELYSWYGSRLKLWAKH